MVVALEICAALVSHAIAAFGLIGACSKVCPKALARKAGLASARARKKKAKQKAAGKG
jgi:hypothetical protein